LSALARPLPRELRATGQCSRRCSQQASARHRYRVIDQPRPVGGLPARPRASLDPDCSDVYYPEHGFSP
jgi:hypothetical protein